MSSSRAHLLDLPSPVPIGSALFTLYGQLQAPLLPQLPRARSCLAVLLGTDLTASSQPAEAQPRPSAQRGCWIAELTFCPSLRPGTPSFRSITRSYYRGSAGALLVYVSPTCPLQTGALGSPRR